MSKFTAGPWIIDDFDISSKADPANLIASLYAVEKDDRGGYYLGEEFKANARLIAAAPDLLEALQDLKREIILSDVDMDYIDSHFNPWLDKARAAITKAGGEA